jgi:hypothetical protein
MSTSGNSEQISSLLQQVKDKTSAFQSQNAEADRVAAIKAAQGLLQALQSPQESVVNITYQVRIACPREVENSQLMTVNILAYSLPVPPNWN